MMTTTAAPVKTDKAIVPSVENQKGIDNHKKAAEHHEEAAKHHHEAAKQHEAGNHEKAAQSTIIAQGIIHLPVSTRKKMQSTML